MTTKKLTFTKPARASLLLLAVAGSPFLGVTVAVAAEPGWYIGASIGESKSKIDDKRIRASLVNAGFTSVDITDNDSEVGFKLLGGYQFNQYFAIEGGYLDLGEFGYTAITVPAGTLSSDIKLTGMNIDAVGILPFTEKFSAFARLGINYIQAKDNFGNGGAVSVLETKPSKSDANYKMGMGLEYDFTPAFGMRVEAERYRMDDAIGNNGDVDLGSVGVVYRFGQGKKPAEAIPVEKTHEEKPALIIVPIAAETDEYCSILDIQFEINKDDIQKEDEEKMSVVGKFMQNYPKTTALIEGHSDNIGNSEDNIRLSLRRADHVVNYLVNNYQIDAARLKSVGYGDISPVADNATEEGKRANRRINAVIACATDLKGITVAPARITMALEMEFEQNKSVVDPMYHNNLEHVAKFMLENPGVTATVEGHASNQTFSPGEAMQLSQERAQSVVDYLVNNFGIASNRLTPQGFGESRRFAYNTSVEGQQENRRVNIIFTYPQ